METLNTSSSPASPAGGALARRLIIASIIASIVLNFVPFANLALYPLNLLVTFIHEGGHALMTVLTGGSVNHIYVNADASGVTESRGGLPFFVLMAGYLGATAFGAFCILLNSRHKRGKFVLTLLAGALAIVVALWVRNALGFFGGLALIGTLLAGAKLLSNDAADFAAAFVSVQLCLNAILDIRTLVFLTTGSNVPNDAVFMAERFGLAPWFWAILWAAGAATILALTLRTYWRNTAR